jgi:hypothetical protein
VVQLTSFFPFLLDLVSLLYYRFSSFNHFSLSRSLYIFIPTFHLSPFFSLSSFFSSRAKAGNYYFRLRACVRPSVRPSSVPRVFFANSG